MVDQNGKVILVVISLVLSMSLQEALAEDVDTTNRLSYISKVIGAVESSLIQMQGDVRFVKRQADISKVTMGLSEKRLNNLEMKVMTIEKLLSSIAEGVAKIDQNLQYVEKGLDALASGSSKNIFLCKRKK